jgi:hypothetical protein
MQGNGVPIGLAVHAQVGALGQRAAQHTVGVLVDVALSRAVRVRKAHRDAGGPRQRLVVRHLTPDVVRHAQAHGRIESVEHKAKALRCVLGHGVLQRHGHGDPGFAPPRCRSAIGFSPVDEVTLPVAWHQTLANAAGALANAGGL